MSDEKPPNPMQRWIDLGQDPNERQRAIDITRKAIREMRGPCFILGAIAVTLGTPKRYTMHLWHNRPAFKPTRLYAHLPEARAFIVERVQWGLREEEQLMCPVDLYEFGMTQQGIELALPTLKQWEDVCMVVQYTGRVMQGLVSGAQFSLPIVWAESGANLLSSQNATLNYSVE